MSEDKPTPKPKPTPQEVEAYTSRVLAQGIAARAQRELLMRVVRDPGFHYLDRDLQHQVRQYLARNP